MSIQRNKLNIAKARRRVQMRSALFLLAVAALLCSLGALLAQVGAAWPRTLLIWFQAVLSLLAFGVTSYLGLKVLDGDQTKMLRLRVLNAPHTLFLALLGVLAVYPVSLLADVTQKLLPFLFPAGQAQGNPPAMAQFLPMMIHSVIIAPVCEELFFRGYLFGVTEREGEQKAVWMSAIIFAAIHGFSAALPGHLLLGVLLAKLMLRTGSILAPMLVHASLNCAILIMAFMGLQGLLSGLSLVSSTVCLLGSAAFVWALRRVYAARAARSGMNLELPVFSKREWAALIGAAAAVIAAGVLV